MSFNKKSRIERLKREIENEKNGVGQSSRKWIIDSDKLEELGITEWRPKVGTNFVQFLPANDPDEKHSIGMELYFHRNVGPDNNSYLCLRKMKNEPCPICEEFQRRRDEDWEEIKHLSIGRRPTAWLFLIADVLDDESIEKGVQSYVAPKTIRDEVINVLHPRTGEIKFMPNSPDEGPVFNFKRTGTGITDTSYSHIGYLEEHEDLSEDLYTDLPSFEELLYVPTYDEVKSAMSGLMVEENEDDEKETMDDLVEETKDSFGAADEDEEEEEEKPKRTRRVREKTPRTRRRRG